MSLFYPACRCTSPVFNYHLKSGFTKLRNVFHITSVFTKHNHILVLLIRITAKLIVQRTDPQLYIVTKINTDFLSTKVCISKACMKEIIRPIIPPCSLNYNV